MNWLFRCNPKRFDLATVLESDVRDGTRAVNQHRQLVSVSDYLFFWQTGPKARMIALGHVVSPVYERPDSPFGRFAVDVAFDYTIEPPLTQAETLTNETLKSFAPFKWAMGTNFIIQDSAVVAEIRKILEGRLISTRDSVKPPLETQQSLDTAIKRSKSETVQRVREYIEDMDPYAFQWLVRTLLLKLGYIDVEVMKQTGDGGVDVRATLIAGGVANIRTCVQVKRQQTVGRPAVQSLRGSLSVNEVGLLVTSGRFTEGAGEEARAPGKVPIALIDGTRLLELLMNLGIGVEHVNVALYRLRLDDLSMDHLQALAEESEDDEEIGDTCLQPNSQISEE